MKVFLSFISQVFYKAHHKHFQPGPLSFSPHEYVFWAWIIQNSKVLAVTLGSRHAKDALLDFEERPGENELRKGLCHQTMSFFTDEGCLFISINIQHCTGNTISHSWKSTCLTVKCIHLPCIVCDRNTQDGINLHVSHLWRSHLSSVLCPSSLFRHMKDPLVSAENKWGWPSSDAHEMDPLWRVDAVAAAASNPVSSVRSISVSEEEGRRVAPLCPFSPSFVSISWSQFFLPSLPTFPPLFSLHSVPTLIFLCFTFVVFCRLLNCLCLSNGSLSSFAFCLCAPAEQRKCIESQSQWWWQGLLSRVSDFCLRANY